MKRRLVSRRILFDGYYGMANVGDDAFCVVAEEVSRRWDVDRGFLAAKEELPVPVARYGVLPASTFKGVRRASMIAQLARAGEVLHVGGSTMRRMNTRRADQLRLTSVGALRLRACGVSIGPFRNAADAHDIKSFLRRFEFISVRDGASVRRAAALGIDVVHAFDVAVLLGLPRPSAHSSEDPPIVGVAPCRLESFGEGDVVAEQTRLKRTFAFVRALARTTGAHVACIACNSHPKWGDVQLCSQWYDALMSAGIQARLVTYDRQPSQLLAQIGRLRLLIGMRMHSCVFAYTAGVPFFVVPYHQKLSDFSDDIELPPQFRLGVDGSYDPMQLDLACGVTAGDVAPTAPRPLEVSIERARQAFGPELECEVPTRFREAELPR